VGVCNEHLQWVFVMRVSKKFYLCGRLQNAPTQHTLKVIDYQIYRLCQSFGTLTKSMMQKRLIIKVINFAKGASRTGRKLWQSIAM